LTQIWVCDKDSILLSIFSLNCRTKLQLVYVSDPNSTDCMLNENVKLMYPFICVSKNTEKWCSFWSRKILNYFYLPLKIRPYLCSSWSRPLRRTRTCLRPSRILPSVYLSLKISIFGKLEDIFCLIFLILFFISNVRFKRGS